LPATSQAAQTKCAKGKTCLSAFFAVRGPKQPQPSVLIYFTRHQPTAFDPPISSIAELDENDP
jgi:hypothetical protein